MSIELITLDELLRDPQYRTYFLKVPKLPDHYTKASLPWKLIVQYPGETQWRSKRFGSYAEAFAGLKTIRPKIQNAAINCPALGFMPPTRTVRLKGKVDLKGRPVVVTRMWVPQIPGELEQHEWCSHCRRPSIFRIAALPGKIRQGFQVPPSEPAMRCSICGISERMVDLRHPEKAQSWDSSRRLVTA